MSRGGCLFRNKESDPAGVNREEDVFRIKRKGAFISAVVSLFHVMPEKFEPDQQGLKGSEEQALLGRGKGAFRKVFNFFNNTEKSGFCDNPVGKDFVVSAGQQKVFFDGNDAVNKGSGKRGKPEADDVVEGRGFVRIDPY